MSADYGGAPLASFARCRWKVSVRPGGSAESWFGTGVMHADEWKAAWIGHDPETEPPFEPPADDREPRTPRTAHLPAPRYFRRELDLRPATSVRIACTARGLYELHVNGVRVGDGELTPGWTDYRHRVPYQVYDVTDPRTVAGTDAGWRETTGPLRYADLLMGEWYDARLELDGWDRPGFDDSAWAPARVLSFDHGVLVPSPAEPVRVTQDVEPVDVRRSDGRTIVDLGQNLAGRVRLTIRGARPGDRVTLRHGEALDDDGGLYTANLRSAEATDHYVAAGRPVETFEPRFTVHGFRHVEITGHPGDFELVGRVLHSDTPVAGEFSCSDATVRQLIGNAGGASAATSSRCRPTARNVTSGSAGPRTRRCSCPRPATTRTWRRSSPAGWPTCAARRRRRARCSTWCRT